MLRFSFSSVFMAVFTSNILMALIYLSFCSKKLMVQLGYKLLGVFLVLTALRFAFPFEILPMSNNLDFPPLFSMLFAELCHPRFHAWNLEFSLWSAIELIWIAGFLILLGRFLCSCHALKAYIREQGKEISYNTKYLQLIEQINKEWNKKASFEVIELADLSIPMICGIRTPCILIPASLDASEKELYFILRHEMLHFYQHDLLIKLLVRILCIFYWWNPISHFFQRKCDTILEMRIDKTLTGENNQTKLDYFSCLNRIAAQACAGHLPSSDSGISLCSKNTSVLTERFHMLFNNKQKDSEYFLLKTALIILISGIYIFSLFFIFEANYLDPKMAEKCIIPSSENTHVIDNEDGTFSVYLYDEYLETVDFSGLEYWGSNLPIYTQGEYEKKKNNGH
ncbi:MAG: M56 family metallopeptidase [Eubacteriales bacterium]|nr:M56 family metallopeptidase [Eubacteriales bacterium]